MDSAKTQFNQADPDLVREPVAMDPKFACSTGYVYDRDLHLCIRYDITARALAQDANLGLRFNRAVTKLRGK